MQRHAIVQEVITYDAAVSACEQGQQHQKALRLLRAMRRHAIVLKGWQHQQTLHLLRAVRRHDVVPDVVTYKAVISAGEKGQQHQQALHLFRVMQPHAIVLSMITYNGPISVWEKRGTAAPAGLTPLASVAALCHRAGCYHLRWRHHCARKGPAAPADFTPLTSECSALPS